MKKNLTWAVAFILAGVLLYYSLRGLDWARVLAIVAHAKTGYLVLAFFLGSCAMFVRSVRWGLLLGAEERISVSTVFWATSVGYLGNNFLPARAGELLRTMMISSRSSLSKSYVFATALTGLVVDLIVLIVLSSLVLTTMPSAPIWLRQASGSMTGVGIAGLAALVILPHCEPLFTRILRKIPLPEKFGDHLVRSAEQFLLGLRAFQHVSRFAAFVGISFSVWFVDAAGALLIAAALHLSLPFTVGLLLLAALGLASSLPSTPGYLGIYQFIAVGLLGPFGFSRNDAIAYILVFQATGYAVFITWGLIGLWRLKRVRLQPA